MTKKHLDEQPDPNLGPDLTADVVSDDPDAPTTKHPAPDPEPEVRHEAAKRPDLPYPPPTYQR